MENNFFYVLFFLTKARIFQEFKNTDTKYKNRIRSRYANLKDSRNPEFRAQVLLGSLPPEKVATMTPDVSNLDLAQKVLFKKFRISSMDRQRNTSFVIFYRKWPAIG